MSTMEIILSFITVLGSITASLVTYQRTKKKLELDTNKSYSDFIASFNQDQETFRKEVLSNYNLLKSDYLELYDINKSLEEELKGLQEKVNGLQKENLQLLRALKDTQAERDDLQKRVKQLEDDNTKLTKDIISMEKELQKINTLRN